MARSVVFLSLGPPVSFASTAPIEWPIPMIHNTKFSYADPVRHTYEFPFKSKRELRVGEDFVVCGGTCKNCPFYDSYVLGLCTPLNNICVEQWKEWSLLKTIYWVSDRYWLYLHLSFPYGSLTDFQKDRVKPVFIDERYSAFFSRLLVVVKYLLSRDTELPGDLDGCITRFKEHSSVFNEPWKDWAEKFIVVYERMKPILERKWS